MSHVPQPVSMVTMAGRFRDNRRGMLQVRAMDHNFAELVIDQPPAFGQPGIRTTIAMSGEEKLRSVIDGLRDLANALEGVTDINAWRDYVVDEQQGQRDGAYWWQQYPSEAAEVTA